MRSTKKIFVLLGVFGLFFAACDKKKEKEVTLPRQIVPEEATNIEGLLSEPNNDSTGKLDAKVKGKLTAPFMLRYQRTDSPYAEFPRTLHVDFYNAAMQVESQLDALYGKYLQNQEKVFLRDSVVVKNIQKGDTVRCQELWWDQHTERFTTDKPVRIYTKDKILFGTGMEADQNFRWYTIRKLTGTVLTAGNNIPK
ncbi:LPS export ABC transporter periplasmic protein LptC [Puia sp. P3]|uniref:LPS export ABC transporter periplasmic protein LptC n=1 Tax=Puia sp. P3 TaxID=3423952 RepID=UPI003D665302